MLEEPHILFFTVSNETESIEKQKLKQFPPLSSDHDVAVEAELGASGRVEMCEVCGEEALGECALLAALPVDGGEQVVRVRGVFHLRGAQRLA